MTEDKSATINSLIVKHVSKFFPGFTIMRGIGYYKGVREKSLTIIIVAKPRDRSTIHNIAEKIKYLGHQECVLVVETPVKTKMIETEFEQIGKKVMAKFTWNK